MFDRIVVDDYDNNRNGHSHNRHRHNHYAGSDRQLADTKMTTAQHDPGGKVRIAIGDDVRGHARFHGTREEYRPWLSRHWGAPGKTIIDQHGNMMEGAPFYLWIGMNPSTADAAVNDPTVLKEMKFTRRDGLTSYVKCNVMDYRATHPEFLRAPGVMPVSSINVETIIHFARHAEKIIVCYGALHKNLQMYPRQVVATLRDEGHKLFCLDLTKEGHPRHPLYIRDDRPLQPFGRAA